MLRTSDKAGQSLLLQAAKEKSKEDGLSAAKPVSVDKVEFNPMVKVG